MRQHGAIQLANAKQPKFPITASGFSCLAPVSKRAVRINDKVAQDTPTLRTSGHRNRASNARTFRPRSDGATSEVGFTARSCAKSQAAEVGPSDRRCARSYVLRSCPRCDTSAPWPNLFIRADDAPAFTKQMSQFAAVLFAAECRDAEHSVVTIAFVRQQS